jgi:predicted XRE-type DNA-binding protein
MEMYTTENIWNVIEDDPAERIDLKARSAAMTTLKAFIHSQGWSNAYAAAELDMEEHLVVFLMKGRIGQLDLATLQAMAARLGVALPAVRTR